MKAAVLEAFKNPFVIKDVELSEPGLGEVTLEVKACGLCLTDIKLIEGKIPTVKLPHIPGHEFAGVIVKKGPGVEGFEIGDRVTVTVDVICGKCNFCLKGETNRCINLKRIGMERNGGMEDYVNVPATNIEKVSERVSFEKAAVIPDAIASMYRAIKTVGGVGPGMEVAILGLGGLGMQGIKICKLMGANVTGTSRNDKKLEMAKSLGANHTINTQRDNFVETARKLVGSFDVIIDNIGIKETILDSIAACKNGGKVVVVGYVGTVFEAPFYDIVIREKQILGSRACTRSEFREVVKLVNSGQLDPEIGDLIPISQINRAVEDLKNGKFLTRNVLTLPFGK